MDDALGIYAFTENLTKSVQDPLSIVDADSQSTQKTAIKALKILESRDEGFVILKPEWKKNVVVAFAESDMVVYGQAFDIVQKAHGIEIDFSSRDNIRENIDHITLCEVKSTNRNNVDETFYDYFFSLTTAELLVAQSLKEKYKFVLVNTVEGKNIEPLTYTLLELLARAKSIHPTWSIKLGRLKSRTQ